MRLSLQMRPVLPRAARARVVFTTAGPPKAVVLDLGKVLLDFDFKRSSTRLAAACQAPTPTRPEVLLELFGHAPPGRATGLLDRWGGVSLVEQLERGRLSNQQFYEAVVEASGLQLDFSTFAALYGDIFTDSPAMIAQQQLLSKAGVPTYLLSNCSGLHIDSVRRLHPALPLDSFQGLALSYEVRSFKPEAPIYEATEDIAQLSGPALVFIDDRAVNAAAAAKRGWRAIHHTSPAETLARLAELGLPVVGG